MQRPRVEHWKFNDGWQWVPEFLRKGYYAEGKVLDDQGREFRQELVGWHCWMYPSDDFEFEAWMESSCPTAECDFRFNGGDPMYTVHITDPAEAALFQLKWL